MEIKVGLEGVVVAESKLSFIDGEKGILIYSGYPIKELADKSTFEEVAFLLWNGTLPTVSELELFKKTLYAERALSPGIISFLKSIPKDAHPMAVLRSAVSFLGLDDPNADDNSEKANMAKAIRLLAQMPSITAAWWRVKNDKEVLQPKEGLSIAANFLYMLTGKDPKAEEARMVDVALILHADHGFNASTFSSRVTVATLSDMYSGITSAIGTLKGPLHGGANQRAMAAMKKIAAAGVDVEEHVKGMLQRKERIMGIGHRVYKVKDPRAFILEESAKQVADAELFSVAKKIEKVMADEKGLYPNVDFFSGMVYEALGIHPDFFTPVFAMSRTAGWVAHMLEQLANNRLIRPRANYVGEKDKTYIPIEQRG